MKRVINWIWLWCTTPRWDRDDASISMQLKGCKGCGRYNKKWDCKLLMTYEVCFHMPGTIRVIREQDE